MIYSNSKRIDLERVSAENICLKDRIVGYQATIKGLQGSLKSVKKTKDKSQQAYESGYC